MCVHLSDLKMSQFYDPIADFYSRPQTGSGITLFQGSRKQVGGGIFASIQRFAVPILRRIGQKLLSIAPDVGSKAMEVVKDTIADVRKGKRIGEAIKSNVSEKIRKTLNDLGVEQSGSGRRQRRRRPLGINKKNKVQRNQQFQRRRRKRQSIEIYLPKEKNDWLCQI